MAELLLGHNTKKKNPTNDDISLSLEEIGNQGVVLNIKYFSLFGKLSEKFGNSQQKSRLELKMSE